MKKFFTLLCAILWVFGVLAADYSETYEWYVESSTDKYSPTQSSNIISWSTEKHSIHANYPGKYKLFNGTSFSTTKGLKLEAATKATFTTTKTGDVVIVQATTNNGSEDNRCPKFDGKQLTMAQGVDNTTDKIRVFTLTNVEPGEHTVGRGGSEGGIIYLGIGYYAPDDPREAAPLSWSTTTLEILSNATEYTLPTFSNPENLPVTFSSNNSEVATVSVDGVITLASKTGTAVITAAFDGNDTYRNENFMTTITVKPATKDIYVWKEYETADVPSTVLAITDAALTAGQKLVNDEYMVATAVSDAKVSNYGANYCGYNFTKGVQAPRVKTAPKDGSLYGVEESGNSAIEIEALKNSTLLVFGRRRTAELESSQVTDAEGVLVTTHIIGMHPDNQTIYLVNQDGFAKVDNTNVVFGKKGSDAEPTSLYEYFYCAYKFDVEAGKKYTLYTTGFTFTMHGIGYYDSALCAEPTATEPEFDFAAKKYFTTFSAPADVTLMVKVDDEADFTAQTSPYKAYFTTKASAYTTGEGLTSSAEVSKAAPATYDAAKPYIAWVYADDYTSVVNVHDLYVSKHKLINALREIGNVVLVGNAKDKILPAEHLASADLIVCSEAMAGGKSYSNALKDFFKVVPMINLKIWNYNNDRWGWCTGKPNDNNKSHTKIYPLYSDYYVLEGITPAADGSIELFAGDLADDNHIQTANLANAPEGNVNMASVALNQPADNAPRKAEDGNNTTTVEPLDIDENYTAMHGVGNDFFALGLSSNDWQHYSDDAAKIVSNAATMLLAGDDVTNSPTTALKLIKTDDKNAPVEYYNLQGIRVENPANGLYIRRQGTQVTKVMVK